MLRPQRNIAHKNVSFCFDKLYADEELMNHNFIYFASSDLNVLWPV